MNFSPDNNPESRLRERLQQHEFDFRPKAWEAMQHLLNDQQKTVGGLPISDAAPAPSGHRRTKHLLWVLLLGTGLTGLLVAAKHLSTPAQAAPVLPSRPVAHADQPDATTDFFLEKKLTETPLAAHATSAQLDATTDFFSEKKLTETPLAAHATSAQPDATTDFFLEKKPSETPLAPHATSAQLDATTDFFLEKKPSETPLAAHTTSAQLDATTDFFSEKKLSETPLAAHATSAQLDATTDFFPEKKLSETPLAAHATSAQLDATTDFFPEKKLTESALTPLPDLPLSSVFLSKKRIDFPKNNTVPPIRWRGHWGLSMAALATSLDFDSGAARAWVRPQVGIFWQKNVGQRTWLRVELQYKNVNGWAGSNGSLQPELLDAANRASAQKIAWRIGQQATRSHLIQLPLTAHHALGHTRWSVSAGTRVSAIFARRSVEQNQFVNVGTGNVPAQSIASGLAHQRFQRLEGGLSAGVEYRIAARWAAQVQYTQGLFDLSDDLPDAQRNSDVQVSMRYFFR
jgi:hypothetical protein